MEVPISKFQYLGKFKKLHKNTFFGLLTSIVVVVVAIVIIQKVKWRTSWR